MGEEYYYNSLNCSYCRYGCKYPQEKGSPTYDDKYKCCYYFYPQEITHSEDLDNLSKYYESIGSERNKDLEFESACKWLALKLQMDDEQKVANSNSPKQRIDGSYVILLNDNHTPSLYKHFCKKYNRFNRMIKIKEFLTISLVITISVLIAVIFLKFLGYL